MSPIGCGCGGKTQQNWHQYTAPNGTVTNFPTQIQARAEQIRQGGGGTITLVPR